MPEDKRPLQLLVVRTTGAAAEAIDALLEERGAIGSAIERRRGARLVRLQAYFPAEVEVPVTWVREKLASLHEYGVPVGPAEVRIVPLHQQDWAEAWKRHFHAVRVTSRLWIVPTWETAPPEASELIRIDPGMAFGQGDHPTTRGCLEMMERIAGEFTPAAGVGPAPAVPTANVGRPGVGKADGRTADVGAADVSMASVGTADVGTGTGILAIRAVQLGLDPVDAYDTEVEAIRAAGENAARNEVEGRITFHEGTLPVRGVGPYRWIFANIFLSILLDLMPRFTRLLDPAGDLVVAGLLGDQEERLTAEARGRGLRVVDRICEPGEPGAHRWPVLRMRREGMGG
jgi:ribosomal protein L11 methyltransferase